MAEERKLITHADTPEEFSIFEVFVDGRPCGFVVVGPDGEYRASSLEKALAIIEQIKRRPEPGPGL